VVSTNLSYAHPDKLVTHNIRPFYFLIFVRFADFINCQIVKWLKSPNGANIVCEELIADALKATAEILVPRVAVIEAGELRRTPIAGIRKTTNSYSI
jgi:hypothetical protein